RTGRAARAISRHCSVWTRGPVPGRAGTRSSGQAVACGSPWGGASDASPPLGRTNKKGAPRDGGRPDASRRRCSGVRAHGRAPPDYGPAVTLAQHAQLRQLLLVQRIVALREIQQRVVEPFLLVLRGGFQ